MEPADKIKMALLAAKLAKESLELLVIGRASLAKLQFGQIVQSIRELDEHLKTLK